MVRWKKKENMQNFKNVFKTLKIINLTAVINYTMFINREAEHRVTNFVFNGEDHKNSIKPLKYC